MRSALRVLRGLVLRCDARSSLACPLVHMLTVAVAIHGSRAAGFLGDGVEQNKVLSIRA